MCTPFFWGLVIGSIHSLSIPSHDRWARWQGPSSGCSESCCSIILHNLTCLIMLLQGLPSQVVHSKFTSSWLSGYNGYSFNTGVHVNSQIHPSMSDTVIAIVICGSTDIIYQNVMKGRLSILCCKCVISLP